VQSAKGEPYDEQVVAHPRATPRERGSRRYLRSGKHKLVQNLKDPQIIGSDKGHIIWLFRFFGKRTSKRGAIFGLEVKRSSVPRFRPSNPPLPIARTIAGHVETSARIDVLALDVRGCAPKNRLRPSEKKEKLEGLPCLIETFTVRRDGGIMYTYIPPPRLS